MTDMPEKIWAYRYSGARKKGQLLTSNIPGYGSTEYARSGIEWNEALEAAIMEADEKENYWSAVAYDKRQAGKDDNFACASASAYAHMGQTLRAMKREPK